MDMALLDPNFSRWIFLILLLLQSVPYGTSQATPPQSHKKANDPVIVVITVLFFIIFVMIFGSVFCRKNTTTSFYPPRFVLDSAPDEETVVRIRRTRGLDSTAVESFPTFLYSEVKRVRIGKGGLECAVCLCEFEDDETLRLMPPCCHVFHSNCVDVWLSENSTCPLCRADLNRTSSQIYINSDPDPDPEQGGELESSDAGLLDGVTWTSSNITPRSKSTGLSSWRITSILFPRSHSTGHSLIQPTENLDRFTLRLPEEVRRQLMKSSIMEGHVELPQARSSRRGYRSGSVGSERSVFTNGHKNGNSQRPRSMSFSFSFRSGSVRSPFGGDAVHPPKDLFRSIESGERSFGRLRPDEQV